MLNVNKTFHVIIALGISFVIIILLSHKFIFNCPLFIRNHYNLSSN